MRPRRWRPRPRQTPAMSYQIDIGSFGLWSWDGSVEALAPDRKEEASTLLILTDGDPATPAGRSSVGMVGFARFYQSPEGKIENWRQPPGGLPGSWRMYPYYRSSPI